MERLEGFRLDMLLPRPWSMDVPPPESASSSARLRYSSLALNLVIIAGVISFCSSSGGIPKWKSSHASWVLSEMRIDMYAAVIPPANAIVEMKIFMADLAFNALQSGVVCESAETANEDATSIPAQSMYSALSSLTPIYRKSVIEDRLYCSK